MTGTPFDDDELHEECGVFGVWGAEDAAPLVALGLHALQHRGQEAAGLVALTPGPGGEPAFPAHRGIGLVGDIFSDQAAIDRLSGPAAIGHTRYATTGGARLRNVQPLYADFAFGGFAIAHNGNLTNALATRQALVERGALFQSTTDTEAIIHLMATSLRGAVETRLVDALQQLEGAYSLVCLSADGMIGVRDPLGVRPLVLGRFGDAYILASETCALDIIGADFIRDVEPGEMIVVNDAGLRSLRPFPPTRRRFCVFEHIYFARPDSRIDGVSVYDARKHIGAELAKEFAAPADVVVPVPDSGVPAAIGYAAQSGLPFELGIIRNHYVGRTFIEPTDSIRHLGVKLKHSPNPAVLEGRRVVLIDDSIVRGTTSRKIVEMVRAAGAAEVHMRIASPPTAHPCFYGIDTPEQDKLLAHRLNVPDMAAHIGADSLAFLSIDGLYRALGFPMGREPTAPQFCDACFTGEYPIPLTDHEDGAHDRQLSLLAESA